MVTQLIWPPLPEIGKDDPRAEVKKIRYQAELDIVTAENAATIALHKAEVDAQIAQAKAKEDAILALKKSRFDARIALHKAEVDAQIAQAKAKEDAILALKKSRFDARIALHKTKVDAILGLRKAKADARIALHKAKADAQIERQKREPLADIEREKAAYANDYAQVQAVNAAYLDVAKASLDRAVARATFVQTAAGAISTLYVGIIALRVGTAGVVPARGLAPTLFLGIAIALAAAYLAFVTKPAPSKVVPTDGTLTGSQRQRRNNFIQWVQRLHCSPKIASANGGREFRGWCFIASLTIR